MDPRLGKLIEDYRTTVAEAVARLERAGIPRPSSNHDWSGSRIPRLGQLEGGYHYRKHGYGCELTGPEWSIDFDFGAQGQIDGFDAWRLFSFAGEKLRQYGFDSREELEHTFEEAITAGDIWYSGYILYYTKQTLADAPLTH